MSRNLEAKFEMLSAQIAAVAEQTAQNSDSILTMQESIDTVSDVASTVRSVMQEFLGEGHRPAPRRPLMGSGEPAVISTFTGRPFRALSRRNITVPDEQQTQNTPREMIDVSMEDTEDDEPEHDSVQQNHETKSSRKNAGPSKKPVARTKKQSKTAATSGQEKSSVTKHPKKAQKISKSELAFVMERTEDKSVKRTTRFNGSYK
ncbi:hypothetical protein KCU67_g8532, partial [Aureobasidium melanogenum]